MVDVSQGLKYASVEVVVAAVVAIALVSRRRNCGSATGGVKKRRWY